MSRIRVIALSMGLVIAALLVHSVSEAQGPGGGGRGGRGGPGGGFGGFGGFGGGFGGGLMSLAQRPGVQAELKLTDKQKTDIAALASTIDARRKDQFEKMRAMFKNGRGPRNQGQDAAGTTDTATTGTTSTKGKTADAKGKSTDTKGKTGKATAKGKGAAAPAGTGGPGGDFRAAMQKQQAEDEAALAKILNPTQRTRLSQIDLQQQGPYAFATPDLQKKLRMTPSQVDDISAIMDEAQQAQRAQRGDRGNNNNGGRGNNNNGGRGGQFGGGQGGQFGGGQGGQANDGQGGRGNNNNGGRGGNNNNGPGGRGNRGGQPLDKEAYQKKLQDDPQFKAQEEQRKAESDARRAEFQARNDELRGQMMTAIAGVLSKNQKVAYNKMRGEDFDRAKLDRNYDPSTAPKEEAPKTSSSKKKTTKTSKSKKTA